MTLSKYNQIINELWQQLAEEQQSNQASIKRIAEMNAKLIALADCCDLSFQTSCQVVTDEWAIEDDCNLLGQNITPYHTPCDNCDKYNTCKEPCELLETKLSGVHLGSNLLKKTYGNLINEISDTSIKSTDDNDEISHKFDINYLKAIDRIRADDIFILYKNCIHLFSKIEWRVVTLRIEEGQTFKTIGLVLGISPSTASDTYQRAKNKMEGYYKKRHVISRKNT